MDIQDIPYDFIHCYATPEQCPQQGSCLRARAAELQALQPQPAQHLSCLTPTYLKQVAAGAACELYRNDQLHLYARGLSRIFEHVPTGRLSEVRRAVIDCFSCERYFYYAQRGERLISPQEQEEIRQVFTSRGLPEPTFSEFVRRYDWNY